MKPTRREFLKSSGLLLGAGALGAWPRLAFAEEVAAGSRGTLIVLYLRGGADPLNTLIPYGDELYAKVRPTIAVPSTEVIRASDYFGFHPAMRELAELYQRGMVAPILCTGSTHPTRSHFDAQDFMERAAPGIKSISEGWLNRFLYDTRNAGDAPLRALAVQPTLPRSLRGEYPVVAVPEGGGMASMRAFADLYSCDDHKAAEAKRADPAAAARQRLVAAGDATIAKLGDLHAIAHREYPDDAAYPRSGLADQFRRIARVMKAEQGLEIAAIDYNGWDHHAYQGGARGAFADMLATVSQAIAAFVEDLGPQRMANTLVLTMTEFGRTVRENGNNGTDHGHGGYMLAVGGPVRGGRFYGGWKGLGGRDLYEGRDLPVVTDFRDVFAETLASLFGFDSDAHGFFPAYEANPRALGFLKTR